MKTSFNSQLISKLSFVFLCCTFMLSFQQLSAQGNRNRGNAGAANNRAKPAANKPTANKPAANNRPAANKPSVNNNRPAASNNKPDVKRPEANNSVADRKNNISNSGNKTNNIGSNNKKVNVDNSRKNVNVNVDNSKNIRVNNNRYTSVRRAPNYRPYARPPYRYGGYRYNCYHPYFYHPYRPFVWGPMWHPWGFFVATLATTAILLSVDNNVPHNVDLAYIPVLENSYYPFEQQQRRSGPSFPYYTDYQEYYNAPTGIADLTIADQYYYDAGVYYLKGDEGYTVVAAPIGAKIKSLPSGYETVSIDDKTKNYYYGGTFYEKTSAGYTVVPPTAGAVVANVSEGGEDVKMGDVTYVKLGDTYFQPIQQDGKNMYEVADVEEDK